MENVEYSRDMLSIYDLCRQGTRALGPGLRYTIWTQGCMLRCEGCVTPESRPLIKEKLVRVVDLADDILIHSQIDGLTISGGEPFLQAAALADLLEMVLEKNPNLTVILFTGYLKEALSWPDAKELMSKLDLLIDGPYVKELNDNIGLRGSSNQRFHYLTSRLLPWREEMERGKRKTEYHLFSGIIKGYGVPSSDMIM